MLRRPSPSPFAKLLLVGALLATASCGDDSGGSSSSAEVHRVPVAFENEFGMRFVLIPAGTFSMGSRRDEDDRREVTIAKPFYIQTTEVTNAQYAAFLKESGYDGVAAHPSSREPYLATWTDGRVPAELGQHPICNVNWHHAQAYCRWLGKQTGRQVRLPREVEWEYVARGKTERTYPWGDSWEPLACNWGEGGKIDGFSGAAPVGSFPAGATKQGVYDLAGNVWEWCQDDVQGVRDDIGTRLEGDFDPKGQMHPLRGGPWCLDAEAQKSGRRLYASPSIADDKIGFRTLVELKRRP